MKKPTTDQLIETLERCEGQLEIPGWCLSCGDWTLDDVEPDAENYECPECGARRVCGAPLILELGLYQ